MNVKVKVIGTPSIEINGEALRLPLKKAEAIVYYLAIEGRASREKLASIFWGTKDENSAYNNFRNALYLLKQYFPKDSIIADRRYVSAAGFSCDLDIIDRISEVDTPLPQCLSDELLKEFDIPECADFGNWLLIAKSQFKTRVTEKLKTRITACYDSQDEDNLESSLEMLIAADPFDEDSTLELMDIYFKRRGAAKASTLFREYKRRLSEELSLTPSARAEEYFKRMIVLDTHDGGMGDVSPDSFFVGRRREQSLIFERLENNDGTVAVFLDGEAGIGKTSLLHKVLSFFDGESHIILSTRSYEAGLDYPYSSWNNLVSQAALYCTEESPEDGGVNFSLLAGVFPNFMSGRRIAYNADSVVVLERTPIIIGRAVSRLVCRAAGFRRPVIVLEDMHWFDKQSIHMLEVFIENLSVPATVFITSRPEKSDYIMRTLTRLKDAGAINFLHIPLKPFDRSETASFCSHFLDKELLESKDKDYFYNETEGMPLLVAEMVKLLRANSKAEFTVSGLGGVMLARFGEISEKQREFLRVLSVFTNGASISLIAKVMGEPPQEVSAVAEELLRKMLIKEIKTIDFGVHVDFSHAKLRSCVYDAIPGFKLSEYHKKVADTLNGQYSPRKWDPALSSMLCYHYTKAGLPKNVLNQHLREMIFDITLNHDLFPLIQDDVLYSCTHPYNDRSDTEKKMDAMSALLADIRNNIRADNEKEIMRMEASYLELCGGYLICWGEYDRGRVLLNRAMKIAREHSFSTIYIHSLSNMGHYFLQTDNAEPLMRTAREMLNVARDDEREKYMGIALRYIGVAFQIMRDYEKSEKVLRRSIAIFEEQALLGKNYTLSMLAAECYIGENYHWQGDFAKAVEHFNHCISVCEEKGLFWGSSHFRAHLADVAFDLGDMEMMFENIYRGTKVFERCQGGRCGSILYSLKSIADAEQKRYEDAYRSLEIGELLSAPIRKHSWISVHAMAKAYLAKMLEEGGLPPQFNKILKKSSKAYAEEAVSIYAKIPVPHRVRMLRERFGL
ncbi:MAG: AAA family ATPase [Cloacibacillus porcorum]|uniref:AAA family ATPase n=1 Tax=Cloacibacillus porcorum TaxID=1197717 RepID=UPI0023EF8C85|nr:AAA family ATPase [Cloacibacillus porcorum]MCD7877545.1 AAA family ATPase [Cloacibacillus porcorum]